MKVYEAIYQAEHSFQTVTSKKLNSVTVKIDPFLEFEIASVHESKSIPMKISGLIESLGSRP